MVKKERENEKNPHYQPQIIKTKTLKIEKTSLCRLLRYDTTDSHDQELLVYYMNVSFFYKDLVFRPKPRYYLPPSYLCLSPLKYICLCNIQQAFTQQEYLCFFRVPLES